MARESGADTIERAAPVTYTGAREKGWAMSEANVPRRISLLWPAGTPPAAQTGLSERSLRDLDCATIVRAFSAERAHHEAITHLLAALCADPAVIRYRQEVLEDLLRYPALQACFRELLPRIDVLGYLPNLGGERPSLYEVTWRAGELENLVQCVYALGETFRSVGGGLMSAGLRAWRDTVARLARDDTFQALARELPDLLTRLRAVRSITVGVNLDQQLRPVEATLVAVNKEKFRSASLLDRLFGGTAGELTGLGPLHGVPAYVQELGEVKPQMVPLFRDLSDVLEKISRPVARALRRYASVNGDFLVGLRGELRFYLGAMEMIQRLTAHGLPMCRPEILPPEARACEIADCYNVNLALHLIGEGQHDDLGDVIVRNDVAIGPQGRIIILTGPNQGGKTTYMQGIGLAQVLAQAGLYVPGSRARISPVDAIYTHYPVEERLDQGTGRFGDEARRLSDIFGQATRHSLLLLNESLSSTSAGESLYLAQDVVRILRMMGTRAVFVTHLHELAAAVDDLNAHTPGDSQIVSLVSSVISAGDSPDEGGTARRSFKVVPSPPIGRSYAHELATRYGVSFQQLTDLLKKRGILEHDPDDE